MESVLPIVDFLRPGVLGNTFGRGPVFSNAARLFVFSLRFVRMIVLKPSVFDVDALAGVMKATPWWPLGADVSTCGRTESIVAVKLDVRAFAC